MYNRKKYKKYACVQLKRRWTIPVLATIIYLVVSAMINIPEFFNTTENLLPVNSAAEFLMDSFFLIELCIVFIIVYAQLNLHLKMSRGPEKNNFRRFSGRLQQIRAGNTLRSMGVSLDIPVVLPFCHSRNRKALLLLHDKIHSA